MQIIEAKIKDIKPNPSNPRTIRDEKYAKLVKSIQDFPEMLKIRPIVVNDDMIVLGGNMRLKACQEAGLKTVPIIKASELTPEQQREFIIKDNVGFGDWDWSLITNDWPEAEEWGLDLPDGFGEEKVLEAVEDDYEIPDEVQTEIVLGDLFEIGPHRLLCGDSTDADSVNRLMNGQKADITIQSPPYNVGKTPNGNEQKYASDSDNKSNTDYLNLINETTKNAVINSVFAFVNIQSVAGNKTVLIDYLAQLKEWFCDYIIWDKMQAEPAMGENVLNSRFEFVYVFGQSAKRRIGVKKFRGNLENMIFIKSRQDKDYAKVHKATYPVAFAAYFIENFSVQSCLDLFSGTGTTMVAAHQLNRKCYGMELDPKYCQVIIDRMRKIDPSLIIQKNGVLI